MTRGSRSARSSPTARVACGAIAVWLAGLAGCNAGDVVIGGLQEVAVLPARPSRDLDLLFVIDDSPSMADKQAALATGFVRMVDKLDQLDGGRPNLHIGVVTSDMGTQGSAVASPGPGIGTIGQGGCTGTGLDGVLQHRAYLELNGAYLVDVATGAGRIQNYAGTLIDAVAGLVRVGEGGCGFEQPFAAMRRALTNPVNAGFVRAEANLAVVIVTDEDDCSALDPALFTSDSSALGPLASFRCFAQGVVCDPDAPTRPGDQHGCRPRASSRLVEPVQPFVDALLAIKPDPRQVMVAGVIGDPSPVHVELAALPGTTAPIPTLSPSCTFDGATGGETAAPAVRLAAFLDGFPGRNQRTSICDGDLSGALDAIGASAKRLVGDPCIDAAALIDSSVAPGIQPACEVTDVRDAAPGETVVLPACADGVVTDCYALVADAAACPDTAEHLRVRVQRVQGASADTWTHVSCQRAP
jgi:hypothetical protein